MKQRAISWADLADTGPEALSRLKCLYAPGRGRNLFAGIALPNIAGLLTVMDGSRYRESRPWRAQALLFTTAPDA